MSLPDKNSFSALGGEKADYSTPVDPTTDRAAAEVNDAFADTAAMTRMIGRAYVTFTTNNPPTLVEHDAVWGNDISVAPVLTRNGAGDYTATWPASVTDARGVSHALNLRAGIAGAASAGLEVATTLRLGPNSFEVWSGAAFSGPDDLGTLVTLIVW